MSHLKYENKADLAGQHELIEDAAHPAVLHGGGAVGDDTDKGINIDVHNMDMTDRYTALKLATEADPGPPIASGRFALFCFYVFICCMCSGDNGGLLPFPPFTAHKVYKQRGNGLRLTLIRL